MNDEIIQCPCYDVCAGLGLRLRRWCRYRKYDLPPPGMHRFEPREEWCPPGVQASVLMLEHALSEGGSADSLRLALARVSQWSQELREQDTAAENQG